MVDCYGEGVGDGFGAGDDEGFDFVREAARCFLGGGEGGGGVD